MKHILLDMYGVILKEARGNFRCYLEERQPSADYEFYRKYYKTASKGQMLTADFLRLFGFEDAERAIHDYVKNYLTFDPEFIPFAERCLSAGLDLALPLNDITEYSRYIREYNGIEKYFSRSIISGDTGIRKPDREIFTYTIKTLGCEAGDCLFIDDNFGNLVSAKEMGINTLMFSREDTESAEYIVRSFEELWIYTDKLFG
jgi:FMN phosphatase YigB (HAD superfamily)